MAIVKLICVVYINKIRYLFIHINSCRNGSTDKTILYMFTTTGGRSFVSIAMDFTFVLRSASLVYGLSRVTLNVPLSNVSLCGTLN